MTSASNSASRFVYDEVQYIGYPVGATHPSRLIALAQILGLNPAPVENCRVLELGCGDGANLIPMASVLPDSRFLGVDLAQTAIGIANLNKNTMGLKNIEFRHMDLLDFDSRFGEFDYIIAHGVYSWVPAVVRDKMMSICQSHLAPDGIAYISYNVYPGCHMRQMMRGMMMYHIGDETAAQEKIRKAGELLKFLADGKPDAALTYELKQLEDSAPESLLHDDMGDENYPVYFHQFAAHAKQYGLQFLAEADYSEMQAYNYALDVRQKLTAFSGDDLIRNEQYLDFLKSRRFRKTLLCRKEAEVTRVHASNTVKDFYMSSVARPLSENPDIQSDKEEEFRGLKGGAIRTNHPMLKAAIVRLGQAWPTYLSFEELLDSIGSVIEDRSPEAIDLLCQMLLRCYSAGILEFYAGPARFTTQVSERPVAFPYARMQAESGKLKITNLKHTIIELDTPGLTLLRLLDGTRDLAAVHRDLVKLGVVAQPGSELTLQSVQQNIAKLGKAALLMA
jgi:methyltransferase-like protein/2-polyprenyl-3-methyl-5-hydroxy-6-metoxy-1,4-benzoquinol methylase